METGETPAHGGLAVSRGPSVHFSRPVKSAFAIKPLTMLLQL